MIGDSQAASITARLPRRRPARYLNRMAVTCKNHLERRGAGATRRRGHGRYQGADQAPPPRRARRRAEARPATDTIRGCGCGDRQLAGRCTLA